MASLATIVLMMALWRLLWRRLWVLLDKLFRLFSGGFWLEHAHL